jgi:exosortase A
MSGCAVSPSAETHNADTGAWTVSLLALISTALITLYLFWPTASSLVAIWSQSRTYSYGFAILPICATLVWRRRDELKCAQPSVSFVGLGVFCLCIVLWLAGDVADVQVVQHFALIALIDSLAWTFLGDKVIRIAKFPMLFLFFAVPGGSSLVLPLQQVTATFTVHALRLSGIPAVQDGLVLSTPSGNWAVAEACSGIRYLSASLVIGVLFAGVAYRSWTRRIAFVCASVVVPIAANALRAYGIVSLGYLSNNRLAAGVDHVLYGWIFFSVTTAVLISAGLHWSEPATGASDHGRQVVHTPRSGNRARVAVLSAIAVVAMAEVSASRLSSYMWARPCPAAAAASAMATPEGWIVTRDLDREWAPSPATMESETTKTYLSNERQVSVYEGKYPDWRRGVELINSSNTTGSTGAWQVVVSQRRASNVKGSSIQVVENAIVKGTERRLVWMWYSTGGTVTADAYRLKAVQAKNRLLGRPLRTSLVAVSTPSGSDPTEAVEVLSNFVK